MAVSYRPYERQQGMLLPASLQDWLPKGHLARRGRRQPDLAVRGRQQHHASIAGQAATVETPLDLPPRPNTPKSITPRSGSCRPVPFGFGTARSLIKPRHLDQRATTGQCRPRLYGVR
jgi:hypothetical protein